MRIIETCYIFAKVASVGAAHQVPRLMTCKVIGSIHRVPKTFTFPGSKDGAVSVIEGKVPSFAFNIREPRRGKVAQSSDITHDMSGGDSFNGRIRISVVRAGDGARGTGGQPPSKAQLGEAISRCQVLPRCVAALPACTAGRG